MKKIIFVLFSILFILTTFSIMHFKNNNIQVIGKNSDDIKKIEISRYGGFECPVREYVIDFTENFITYNYTYLNNSEDNQYSSRSFTKEDVEYFIEKANLYGFFNWKKSYKTKNGGHDLPYTYISIIYKNDGIQIIDCDNAYPPNYDKMAEVFYETFGYNIL